jgi:ChrR-like protein with cupin domain
MRKSIFPAAVAALALAIWSGTLTGDDTEKAHGSDAGHVLVKADALKWIDGPPGLPAGAKIAVIAGDPSKPGPYVLRARMPDGYKIPPHWHPTTENVTVLSGTLHMGKGEKFDAQAAEALSAGGFASMPRGMRHFAYTSSETIIQIHGIGPFEITYVNPADDPRKK